MLKNAYRNVWRNKRRTIITLVTVTLGTSFILMMRFFSYGSHEETIKNAVSLSSGYVQIAANGWLENKPLERALDVDSSLLQKIHSAGVETIAPRIFSYALAAKGSSSRFVAVVAGNPDKEKLVTNLYKRILSGRGEYFRSGYETIPHPYNKSKIKVYYGIVGNGLADNLDAGVGSLVHLVGSQFDGSIGAIPVRITGIYLAHDTALDNSTLFTSLEGGEELYALSASLAQEERGGRDPSLSRYTSLVLGVNNYRDAESLVEKLKEIFPTPPLADGESRENSLNYDPVVHSYGELIPGIIQLMLLDQISGEITLAFLIIIVAFGVLNTVQMSLHERYKEFGIMMAIGTRPGYIMRMVLLETFFIVLPGILLGTIIGVGFGTYFHIHPIVFTGGDAKMMTDMGFSPVMPALVDISELGIGILSIGLPSLVFAMLSVLRISRLRPVEAISTMN